MSATGVGNERRFPVLTALGLALLLAGCSTMSWPFNTRQAVFRAPAPPEVVTAHSTTKNLPPCPRQLITQAQWLARNMARVRLGQNKLQVVSVLGDPATSETFSLTNGAVVEVLFYHTPETICRVNARSSVGNEGLMPLVFQDDRLLGYGQNYYRGFIIPMMRPMAAAGAENNGLPQQRVMLEAGPDLAPAPARRGRLMQEDLPPQATPPASIYAPTPVPAAENGYSGGMNTNGYSPTRQAVGRGAPLQ